MGLRRSQSAIVGALIIAIVMFASLATALYLMNQYGVYSRLSSERSQVLSEAAELQKTANVYWYSSPTPNGTNVTITLSSGYPYAYEVTGIVLRLSNGTLLSYGPGAYPGFLSVVTASGSQYWLPASSPAGGSVTITLSFRQPVQVQAVSLVLQSGDAVAAVAASSYSYLLAGSGSINVNPYNQSSLSPLIGTLIGADKIAVVGASRKIAVPVVYKILNLTPIILYNPTNLPTPAGLTVNLTINLNNAMVKKYSTTYSVNGVNVPLANVLFAYWTGTQWDPLYGWIESFNSSAATVWVRLDRQILPYNNLTIYMLFVNDTTLGTTSWGVNSYYTQDLSLDNIGYVMQGGVLYQVYIDANGSLYNSGGGKSGGVGKGGGGGKSGGVGEGGGGGKSGGVGEGGGGGKSGGVGETLSQYCTKLWNSSSKSNYLMVGLTYSGLGGFLYNLPLYGVSRAFTSSNGTCVFAYNNATESGSPLYYYYSPTNPTLSFNNTYTCKGTYGGLFLPYGEPQLATPANEPVLARSNKSGSLVSGYDVLFNYGQGSIGGNPWPYGLSSAQVNQTWLVKGLGWVQLSSTNVNLSVTTDDGTMVLLGTSPGGGNFTNWLGAYTRSSAILPIWIEDYPNDPSYTGPVTFEAPLGSLVNKAGDYRVVIEYFQDIGSETYFAVFVPNPSMAANLMWYAPVFPPGGSYPYAFAPLAPGLLLGPPAPVQGWIVG
ncbi:MAG: hypothetical protein GU352_03830 [Acidilobus sp.]|nr:hypothetical protein [Acidilobus sp.]